MEIKVELLTSSSPHGQREIMVSTTGPTVERDGTWVRERWVVIEPFALTNEEVTFHVERRSDHSM